MPNLHLEIHQRYNTSENKNDAKKKKEKFILRFVGVGITGKII